MMPHMLKVKRWPLARHAFCWHLYNKRGTLHRFCLFTSRKHSTQNIQNPHWRALLYIGKSS